MTQVLTRRRATSTPVLPVTPQPLTGTQFLLQEMQAAAIIPAEEWEVLPAQVREELSRAPDTQALLSLLVAHGLLTEYQAGRLDARKTFGLVMGNYRVLDRLGAGGMGVVFKAEHIYLRRPVAIKVLAQSDGQESRLLGRFAAEMRTVARLQHPNIVAALDAGKAVSPDPTDPVLYYLVLEFVPWPDLENWVVNQGPLGPAQACHLAYQLAGALVEVHRHHLVHRDIKPSNVLVGPQGEAKLLDFGLVRHWCNRLTGHNATLGTFDFMAPEQGQDAGSVDIRADVYGLGGVLYWCLTGKAPFSSQGDRGPHLAERRTLPAPSVRALRPDLSPELEAVVARMLAPDRAGRYPDAETVRRALHPFLNPAASPFLFSASGPAAAESAPAVPQESPDARRVHRILIVDDDPFIRQACRQFLEADGHQCDEAATGIEALDAAVTERYDLLLLDINLPEMKGSEVVRHLIQCPPYPHLKVIVLSGLSVPEEMAQLLLVGADDFVTKPVGFEQIRARVQAALRLKDAQDRADLLNRNLLQANAELEQHLLARDSDLVHARNALVLALAKLVEYRDPERGAHLVRLQRYCRCLAEEAARAGIFTDTIDPQFIQTLEYSVPLHDIGKVGLPDRVLLRPGPLDGESRIIMESHTVIGAETLGKVARQHGNAISFLRMAIDIARHHHERYDGTGYPDRLAGAAIPLAARITAVADAYDTLRSWRPGQPALSHVAAVRVMTEAPPGQFDPQLLEAFGRCASHFERIFADVPDGMDV